MKLHLQKGFTLVELMIASAVFSAVLIVISIGLIQVGRMFFKGVTVTNTQEVARGIIDDISQAIQFSGATPILLSTSGPGGSSGFCIGPRRYSYTLTPYNKQLVDNSPNSDQATHVMVVDQPPLGCNISTVPQDMSSVTAGSRELMGLNMRLGDMSLTLQPFGTGLYKISVRVVYGDVDLLDSTRTQCAPNIRAGTQFCAYSELITTVQQRIQ